MAFPHEREAACPVCARQRFEKVPQGYKRKGRKTIGQAKKDKAAQGPPQAAMRTGMRCADPAHPPGGCAGRDGRFALQRLRMAEGWRRSVFGAGVLQTGTGKAKELTGKKGEAKI